MRGVLTSHLIPVLLALIFAFLFMDFVLGCFDQYTNEQVVNTDGTYRNSKNIRNLDANPQREWKLVNQLANKNALTIFGSSEFNSSSYAPYNFLSDSIGIPTLGMGEAYHQNLGILIELLAAEKHLDSANVCVVLSTGWFASKLKGTNISSFLKCATPNFVSSIVHNSDISPKYKQHLGKYISNHEEQANGLTPNLEMLRDDYLSRSLNPILRYVAKSRQHFREGYPVKKLNYNVQKMASKGKRRFNYLDRFPLLKKQFLHSSKGNDIMVSDEYFDKYLKLPDGTVRAGRLDAVELESNAELLDFTLLLELLAEKNVKASFIIQSLNPHYYKSLENYDPLVSRLIEEIELKGFPYLNMHESDPLKYDPGTLRDVMHTGDYGWLKVNQFLNEQYQDI